MRPPPSSLPYGGSMQSIYSRIREVLARIDRGEEVFWRTRPPLGEGIEDYQTNSGWLLAVHSGMLLMGIYLESAESPEGVRVTFDDMARNAPELSDWRPADISRWSCGWRRQVIPHREAKTYFGDCCLSVLDPFP